MGGLWGGVFVVLDSCVYAESMNEFQPTGTEPQEFEIDNTLLRRLEQYLSGDRHQANEGEVRAYLLKVYGNGYVVSSTKVEVQLDP